MVSVVGTGLSSVFAAFSFAGAGFLFSHLNKRSYDAEIKRHNAALETLAKAKEKWYENEVRQKDRISELRQQLSDANHDINSTNQALSDLRRVQSVTYSGRTFTRARALTDYYKPSKEMHKYQEWVMMATGLTAGYLVTKFFLKV